MSNLNLSDIREEVKAAVKSATLSNSRIDRWANIVQNDIFNSCNPKHAEDSIILTTIEGQRSYYLNCNPFKILGIEDIDNNSILVEKSEQQIINMDPELDETGTPIVYSQTSREEIQAQLATASVLSAVSTSATDTTQTVRFIGKDANNVRITEEVTLTGTAVATTTNSFTVLQGIRKSDSTVGIVTVTDATANVLCRISPEDIITESVKINFYYIPSDAFDLRIRYIRHPFPLVEPEDIPDMPQMFHHIVLLGTLIKAHENNYDFEIAQALKQDYELEKMKFQQNQDSVSRRRQIKAKGKQGNIVIGRYPLKGEDAP